MTAEATTADKVSTPRLILKGAVLLLTMAAIGWGAKVSGLQHVLDQGWIDQEVKGHGLQGELLFLAMSAVAIAIGVPRQVPAFLAGYAFGPWVGCGLGVLATALACIANFFYARLFGRELVMARFAKRIGKVDHILKDSPFTMTLLIRFLPLGSNLLTNLVAGVSSVPALAFIAGSAVGYIPQTLIASLMGSGVKVDSTGQIIVSAALFLISTGLGVLLFRRMKADRAHAADLDGITGGDSE